MINGAALSFTNDVWDALADPNGIDKEALRATANGWFFSKPTWRRENTDWPVFLIIQDLYFAVLHYCNGADCEALKRASQAYEKYRSALSLLPDP